MARQRVPAYENEGAGSELVRMVIDYANQQGKKLSLCACPTDDSISLADLISFYEHLGFYGVTLLEIEIPDEEVRETPLPERDEHHGKYLEYVAREVPVQYISAAYIPELFQRRVELPERIASKITWCGMLANHYGDDGKESCPGEVLEQFSRTAEIMDASSFNFFRGVTQEGEIIDLYDIRYVF